MKVWPVAYDHGEMNHFVREDLGMIREALQAVEDALVDGGYNDFLVITRNGSFHWMKALDGLARN